MVENSAGIHLHVPSNVTRMMGIFITDGVIEDEQESMDYCFALGEKLLAAGFEDRIKLGLLGIGSDVDRDQIERFDNMFEKTALATKIDLWTGGVATDWHAEHHILGFLFGELFDEDILVLNGSCSLHDTSGTQIPLISGKSLADGLPGKFRFHLPPGQRGFTLKTPAWEVTQDISEALT